MSNATDTANLRGLASHHASHGNHDTAAALREAAQTIDDLRAASASLGPCVPERLTRYRVALLTGATSRVDVSSAAYMADRIETAAHAMLRAEREPEPR